jgi:quercetin dioxygenase-like cupin family protein
MQASAFEAELKSGGYVEIETRLIDPRPANDAHAHDIKGLVLDGLFIVIRDGQPVPHRAGDTFAVPAGKAHAEEIGPQGAKVLVGNKY